MAKNTMKPEEVIKLLSKLKAETSEYPNELVNARKNTFLKNILEKTGSGGGQDQGGSQPEVDRGGSGEHRPGQP